MALGKILDECKSEGRRICLVEDSKRFMTPVMRGFKERGFLASSFLDPQDFIDRVDLDGSFLVLCDMNFSERGILDKRVSLDVVRYLKEKGDGFIFHYVTAYDSLSDRHILNEALKIHAGIKIYDKADLLDYLGIHQLCIRKKKSFSF